MRVPLPPWLRIPTPMHLHRFARRHPLCKPARRVLIHTWQTWLAHSERRTSSGCGFGMTCSAAIPLCSLAALMCCLAVQTRVKIIRAGAEGGQLSPMRRGLECQGKVCGVECIRRVPTKNAAARGASSLSVSRAFAKKKKKINRVLRCSALQAETFPPPVVEPRLRVSSPERGPCFKLRSCLVRCLAGLLTLTKITVSVCVCFAFFDHHPFPSTQQRIGALRRRHALAPHTRFRPVHAPARDSAWTRRQSYL